ncbi:MAG TPA: hypothetical protein VGC89_19165 [Pyrinomonadaceae bacterium]|jgi:hypothetical protein
MPTQRLFSMLLLCLLLCLPATQDFIRAQGTASQPAQKRRETTTPATSKALALLDETLRDVESLKLPENRAWAQAQAASLLWKIDEKRARRLFQEALAAIEEIESDLEDDDAPDESLRQTAIDMRHEVLQLIGERDFQLAVECLRRSNVAASTDEEDQLRLEVAARVSNDDPQQALRLAHESLSRQVSYKLVELVAQLHETDSDAATKLAGEIVSKLKAEDFKTNREAAAVACELLRIALKSSGATNDGAPSLLNQQDAKALMEMTATAALRVSNSQPELLLALQSLLPAMETIVPSLVARLRRQVNLLSGFSHETNSGNDDNTSQAEPGEPAAFAAGQPRSGAEQSADLLARATEVAGKGDKARAPQLLDEAANSAHVFSRAKNWTQLAAQLEVARSYLSLAPDKSLAILETMIDQLDELASAALVVNGFLLQSNESFARRGELSLRTIHLFLKSRQYDELLASVARANLEGLLNASDRFQRVEARIMARLIIVNSALSQK